MKKRNLIRYYINAILIGCILGILACIIIEKIDEKNITQNDYYAEKLSMEQIGNDVQIDIEEAEEYPKENIDNTFEGYDVCAKLEIPTISLVTDVLSEFSKSALKVCVTKYWGVEPNEIGNCSIAGHNTKSKNMFYNLKKLQVGDTIFLTDKNTGKVEYNVFLIRIVLPNDTSMLDAVTKLERELTLITCTNDGEKRIIVKAREV